MRRSGKRLVLRLLKNKTMKTRNGFVSNSSSSSFTCDVCGTTESGYDASLSDFGMMQCIRNHTFCESEAVKSNEDLTIDEKREALLVEVRSNKWNKEDVIAAAVDKITKMSDDEIDNEYEEDGNYEVAPARCPICSMKEFRNEDVLYFLLKKQGKTFKVIGEEIKNEFGDFEKFMNYLK